MILEVNGRPPATVKTGDSSSSKPARHGGRSAGSAPIKVLVTYAVEKGEPLATPAK